MPVDNIAPIKLNKERTAIPFRELGETGVQRTSGYIDAAPLTQLRGQSGIAIFTEMYLLDPVIGSFMFAIEQTVRQSRWHAIIERAADDGATEGQLSLAERAQKHIESCIKDMRPSWNSFVSDALTTLPYGWSVSEIVYKQRTRRNSKYPDGKVGWQKIALRQQHTLDKWEIDKSTGEVYGMWQNKDYAEDSGPKNVYLPFFTGRDNICKALHLTTKSAGGNPEGMSIFMNAYRPWYFRKRLEEIEAIGIERDLNGVPKLKPPPNFDWEDPLNANALTYAKKLVTSLRRDEYAGVILPGGDWELELLSAQGTRQHNTSEIINRYDKRIAMTCMAQFIMLGMERVGSFALVKSLSAMWLDAIDAYLYMIEEKLNEDAIPSLLKLNGEFDSLPVNLMPKLRAERVNAHDLIDLSNLIDVLAKNDLVDFNDPQIQDELLRILRLPQSKVGRPAPPRVSAVNNMTGQGRSVADSNRNDGANQNKRVASSTSSGDNRSAGQQTGRTRRRKSTGGPGRQTKT